VGQGGAQGALCLMAMMSRVLKLTPSHEAEHPALARHLQSLIETNKGDG